MPATQTVRIQDATGDFNDAMRGRAFFMLDEALFGGDKAAASKIKGIVATHRLSYNQKFLPLVTLPSAINLWILSNADQPAYIEEEDARYWALRVNEDRVGDHDYFKALATEARNGGRMPMQDFWQVMTDVGFEMVKSNGIRYRLLPDPKACEEALVALWK